MLKLLCILDAKPANLRSQMCIQIKLCSVCFCPGWVLVKSNFLCSVMAPQRLCACEFFFLCVCVCVCFFLSAAVKLYPGFFSQTTEEHDLKP